MAALCAGRQGRFWEMNDLLFQQAEEIRQQDLPVRGLAERLALSLEEFDCCMGDPATRDLLARDIAEANRLGIRGTPAFRIDGQIYYGKVPDDRLKAAGINPPPP
jgi:protein-disulfide isomerase